MTDFLENKNFDKNWWKYYFHGKAFGKPLANIQKDKLDEIFVKISE